MAPCHSRERGAPLTTRTIPAPAASQVSAVHRPPSADIALLAVAVCAVGTSGPLIAATAAPALAIALWRNVFGAAALAPAAFFRHLREFRGMARAQWLTALAAGVS